jgi:hypothetical protein
MLMLLRYDMLLQCWQNEGEERPTFQEISEQVAQIVEM